MTAPITYPTGAQIESPPNGFIPLQGVSPQAAQVRISQVSFVVNGVTPVTVAAPQVTATSAMIPYLLTAGGTVGAIPAVKTITAGTGFTIAGSASDTSTYGVLIIG